MNLVVLLNLDLWVVLRVLFDEFYFVSIDAAVVVDGLEEDFYATRQGLAYRVCYRPGIG